MAFVGLVAPAEKVRAALVAFVVGSAVALWMGTMLRSWCEAAAAIAAAAAVVIAFRTFVRRTSTHPAGG